jgi:prevent-host-death family protein
MVMKAAAQPEIRTIPAGEFKAKCLQLMDEVQKGKLTLVITKRGKAVSHLVQPPQEAKPFRSIVGRTPGGRLPGEKEWLKSKDDWAEEWDDSTRHLVKLLKGKPERSRQG